MIKPVAQTNIEVLHPFLVKCHHVWYDTTVESQNPPILREKNRYYIQWKNIWASIKEAFKLPENGSTWVLNPQRGAIALTGTVGRNPDWVTFGTVEEDAAHAAVSGFTISHDATGADILVFRATLDVNAHTISTTYAGAALTEITSVTTNRAAYIQYKGSPATGTNNLVATYSVNDNGFGCVTTYSGSAGTMSNGTTTTGNSTSASLAVTTTNGDMAVDCLTIGTAATLITIGANQTQQGANSLDTWFHDVRCSDETATGITTTMSWSWTTSANYAFAAANVNQVTGGTVAYNQNNLTMLGVS